jgi:uncharacterized protein (TIGR03435 family)
MRRQVTAFTPVIVVMAMAVTLFAHASPQSSTSAAIFEAVSIKRSPPDAPGAGGTSERRRPDGGFTITNVVVGTLISRAYPPAIPREMVGLPDWAMRERYDVSATSPLSVATAEDRMAMLRAMLAERFGLVVHFEKSEEPAFHLILDRSDGNLGPGIKPLNLDCAAHQAEMALNAGTVPQGPQRPDFKAPPPRCTVRILDPSIRDRSGDGLGRLGHLLEGETTMANLASALRPITLRFVVDKTGLQGSYALRMNFDWQRSATLRGPDAVTPPDSARSVFTAVREQLGLRLEPSGPEHDILVIDRLERPTEN